MGHGVGGVAVAGCAVGGHTGCAGTGRGAGGGGGAPGRDVHVIYLAPIIIS